jgi:hypothetical protein
MKPADMTRDQMTGKFSRNVHGSSDCADQFHNIPLVRTQSLSHLAIHSHKVSQEACLSLMIKKKRRMVRQIAISAVFKTCHQKDN